MKYFFPLAVVICVIAAAIFLIPMAIEAIPCIICVVVSSVVIILFLKHVFKKP